LTNEHTLTLTALDAALSMEIEGKEFYLKSSRECRNEVGRLLFQGLAAEEDRHRQKFQIIYKEIAANKEWPNVTVEPHTAGLEKLFDAAASGYKFVDNELQAVQTAMNMENKTRDYYLQCIETSVYPAEKYFYQSLAREERVHHNLLQDYYEYVQNPAQFFTIKEKHSLDGG
jgi:rubrerythrin